MHQRDPCLQTDHELLAQHTMVHMSNILYLESQGCFVYHHLNNLYLLTHSVQKRCFTNLRCINSRLTLKSTSNQPTNQSITV